LAGPKTRNRDRKQERFLIPGTKVVKKLQKQEPGREGTGVGTKKKKTKTRKYRV
jgi:hypothetical protein